MTNVIFASLLVQCVGFRQVGFERQVLVNRLGNFSLDVSVAHSGIFDGSQHCPDKVSFSSLYPLVHAVP